MIQMENLTKEFSTKVAVKGIDLHVKKGELFVFLGPNGAGKTTTIKMLTGLVFPTSGTLKVNGLDVVKDSLEIKKILAYVPDEPYLYDKLTGREFLRFVGDMYGMDRFQGEKKIEELIDLFQARSYIDTLCESYSHGMKQRVVIASMLLHSPQVVVIDEPMVGLDPQSSRLFKDIIVEMTKRGTTIFMSTHTLSVAEELADRIGIIHQGKIIALGTFKELQNQYKSEDKNLEELFLDITRDSGGEEKCN